jgi:transcriptional regulator with XRE-family HTH domain/ribosomal protein L37E
MNETTVTKETADREVIRCKTCGLVQYRTRTGNCRRCLRPPSTVERLIQPAVPKIILEDDRQLFEKSANQMAVENIGLRIRQLRRSRRMTQCQLHARSRVSRSWLSRIESGLMTPSLGTLEKLSEALGVSVNRFLALESGGEDLFGDLFIQGLRPFLRQLDWAQWQSILRCLASINWAPRAIALSSTVSVRSDRKRNAPAGSSGFDRPPLIG